MKKITCDNQLICIIYRENDWQEGLNFITPNDLFIQVGSWWYPEGKKLDSHIHKEYLRTTQRTQEMTYVKKGSMRVSLFDEGKNYLEDFTLYAGDLAIFAYGGHGYTILEEGTQVIEAKNGPFVDVSTDKQKF